MTIRSELPAIEAYEIRMVETGRLGPVSRLLHKIASIVALAPTPGVTHPMIFDKVTGEKATPITGVGTFLCENIQSDLETLTAAEFARRYLDR